MALTHTPVAELKTPCPDFRLPGVDGKLHELKDFKDAEALLVMFICNHCPYVKAIEDRLIDLGNEYKKRSVAIVGISSNDAENYPEDSFENMKKRAELKKYPFPYLHDDSQKVAKAFGAVCTPDFFLYNKNRELVYRGRLDDSWKDPSLVKSRDLAAAIDLVLKTGSGPKNQTSSMGCSIKWK